MSNKVDNDIFIINTDGYLEINKPEARNIPEFKTIIVRDKGSEGDYDGRKKVFAFKELMFCYLYYHPLSMYRELPDEERLRSSRVQAELPDEWKVDEVITLAGRKMIETANLSGVFKTYINTSRAIYSIGEDIKFFNERREKLRKKLMEKFSQLDETVEIDAKQELEREADYLTNGLMDMATKITNLNDSLPKAYDTVEKLKQKIHDDEEEQGKIYGGGIIGNRED